MTVSLRPVSQRLRRPRTARRRSAGGSTTSNVTSWMWIGWASAVKLWISQTSVAPSAGFSVIGSSQPSGLPLPSGLSVPRSASTGRTARRARSRGRRCRRGAHLHESRSLVQRDLARVVAAPQRRDRRQHEPVGRRAGVALAARDDVEPHHLAGRVRVGRLEVDRPAPRRRTARRARGSQDDLGPERDVREVDDHVGALRRAEQQLRDARTGAGRKPPSLPICQNGRPLRHAQDQEARRCSRSGSGSGSGAARRRGTARCGR